MMDIRQLISGAMGGDDRGKMTDDEKAACMLNIARMSNKEYGTLDKQDGYNCPKCLNKGFRYIVTENKDFGYLSMTTVPCSCKPKRMEYQRNRASGLPEGYSFESFQVNTDWQREMRDAARRYLDDKAYKSGAWFFAGGEVGAGKTHIVTALAREILYDRDVKFMSWIREAREMKSAIKDGRSEDYDNALWTMTTVDVLFIDDFFKGVATEADKKLAYDILNDRYNTKSAVLMTSELTIDKLGQIDDSIASRIYERAGEYRVNITGGDKNVRYKIA